MLKKWSKSCPKVSFWWFFGPKNEKNLEKTFFYAFFKPLEVIWTIGIVPNQQFYEFIPQKMVCPLICMISATVWHNDPSIWSYFWNSLQGINERSGPKSLLINALESFRHVIVQNISNILSFENWIQNAEKLSWYSLARLFPDPLCV